jgi:hypothetical protein
MPKRRAASIAVAAFLAVQVVVPALALVGDRPGRFGWQMYSAFPGQPAAWVVEADGTEHPLDLGELFAVERAEIDYAAVLLSGLCDVTDAAAIKVERAGDTEPETVACR